MWTYNNVIDFELTLTAESHFDCYLRRKLHHMTKQFMLHTRRSTKVFEDVTDLEYCSTLYH